MSRAIVLLSGGIDSAAALFWAKKEGHALTALSFDYHLRPESERRAGRALAPIAGATLLEVPLPFVREAVDLKAAGFAVPRADGAPEGWVPARNLVFYAIAAYYAEATGAGVIVGGHLARDAEAFADASRPFFDAFEDLIAAGRRGTPERIRLVLPFATMQKQDVLRAAEALGVPLEHTWSCYGDGDRPCGRCVSCRERADAFAAVRRSDPGMVR